MWRTWLNRVGRVLISAGLLALLFTAYQIWGTALTEAHNQDVLRAQLNRELPQGAAARANRLAQAATSSTVARRSPTSTPTTTPPRPPSAAPSTPPPPEGQAVGSIQIPSIGVNQVIVEGVATDDLMKGPGHYPGTSLPGQPGNAAIAGHRTTYARPFYNLDAVPVGGQVIVTTPQGIFIYTATGNEVVSPSDVSVLDQTPDPELTLTTCNPRYSAATRLVLHAKLLASYVYGTTPTTSSSTTTTLPPTQRGRRSATGSSSLAGENVAGSWISSILWGVAVAATLTLTWYLGRRFRPRWAIWAAGTLGMLALLFFFFGAVSPLLPASF
jgi:LPXTG-site transpeptidase (sortase) family protein